MMCGPVKVVEMESGEVYVWSLQKNWKELGGSHGKAQRHRPIRLLSEQLRQLMTALGEIWERQELDLDVGARSSMISRVVRGLSRSIVGVAGCSLRHVM